MAISKQNARKRLDSIESQAYQAQAALDRIKSEEAVDLSSVPEGVEVVNAPSPDLKDLSIAFSGKATPEQMGQIESRNPAMAAAAMSVDRSAAAQTPVSTVQEPEEEDETAVLRNKITTLDQEIAEIEKSMSERQGDRNDLYEEYGVFDDMQALNKLKADKRRLEDRGIEIGLEGKKNLRGRRATKRDLSQLTGQALEDNVLQTLVASRNVARLNDTIQTNLAIVDSYIQAETDKDEFLYTQKKDRLNSVTSAYSDILTEAQKEAAAEKEFQYDLALEAVKTDNALRSDLIKEIAKKGVGGVQLQGLMDASIDELVSFQADLVDPVKSWGDLSVEDASQILDKDEFDRFMEWKEWEKTADEEESEAVKQGIAVQTKAKGVINIVEDMLNDEEGLKTSVGVGFGNRDFNIFGAFEESAKFRAKAKQLISQKTLDSLLELKAAGGTLGAISEKELQILQDAAVALGTVYDKKGKATGRFNLREEDFEEALETMRIASMRTYIASRIGAEAFANADYLNADYETIEKRYQDLVENGVQGNYAEEELRDTSTSEPQAFLSPTLDLLRQEEGLRTEAYQDVTGKWTIGYGTTTINGRPVRQGDKLTEDQAEQIMREQVVNKYTTFADKVQKEITPNQFAALTSFEYNLGPGVWNTPTGRQILSLVDSGRYSDAGRLMLQYNKARDPRDGQLKTHRVLAQRRAREADLLLS